MQYRRPFFLLTVIVLAALINGCGVPALSGGNNSQSSSVSGGFISTIGINIEATSNMLDKLVAGSSFKLEDAIFDTLTPAKAYAYRGLSSISSFPTTSISVVALGPNLTDPFNTSIPVHVVEKPENGGGYIIKFREKLNPQLNLVVRVRLPNGAYFYGPLYETGDTETTILNPIDINIGTTYVIKTLFEAIDDASTLTKLLPCSNPNIDCNTQHKSKVQILKNATSNAAFYEIDFDSELSYNESLALLENNTGFANSVDIMVREILRTESPIAKGTPRTTYPLDTIPWSREYNSSYFNIAINNYRPDNSANEVVLATASSEIIGKSELLNTDGDEINPLLPIYPSLVTSTDVREIRRDAAVPQIPFTRTPLLINSNKSYFANDEDSYQFYSSSIQNSDLDNQAEPASTVFSRLLTTEGQLLLDRDIPQQIPGGPVGSAIVGWNYDPIYSRLYQSNYVEPGFLPNDMEVDDYLSSPTWLTSAYYGGGKSYSLLQSTNGAFSINSELERLNVYSWEVHGLETDENFRTSNIGGRDFGVISYGVKLDDTNPVIKISAETFRWAALSSSVSQTQPTNHYQSRTLERNANSSFIEPAPTSTATSINRTLGTVETEEVTQDNPSGDGTIQGLVQLDGGSRPPIGHSSQSGQHLAFSFDAAVEGRGLILATELRTTTPNFSNNGLPYRYKIQGNTIEMKGLDDTATTIFRNLTDSELSIRDGAGDCSATLSVKYVRTEHVISDNSINTKRDVEDDIAPSLLEATSSDCRLSGGEIEITFSEVLETGSPLTLKGFVTHASDINSSTPGNLINLLWIQPGSLGLVFAQRDAELESSFPPVNE
jgi:hypothetical protein